MKKNKTHNYDAALFLGDDEQLMSMYMQEAFDSNDPNLIRIATENIARAKSMTKLAKDVGVNRESLYKSLSKNGNPSFFTMLKIINNLGFKLSIVPM